MNGIFKDTRLIEAFDQIDPKYIAEVGESLKLRSVRLKGEEYKKQPFSFHVKQILALVGGLILLSAAFPAVNYAVKFINSFAAGWGSTTTEELTDVATEEVTTEMTDSLMSDFISDAELSENDIKTLNKRLEKKTGTNEKFKSANDVMNCSVNYDDFAYYGKINEYLVYYLDDFVYGSYKLCVAEEVIIDIYKFLYPYRAGIYIDDGKTILEIEDAYNQGLITKADIIVIHQSYYVKDQLNPDHYIIENISDN